MDPMTPKGFRDFLPVEAKKRQFILQILSTIFEKYGFQPLETPALEFAEILKGKYGEEEKLIYEFIDHGGRRVALRYDQTVPLSRVIAQYPQLPKPFKRYQIQPVWRAENTQKGRYREFLQCDIDTVGTTSLLADAEVIAVGLEGATLLGLKNVKMLINDRSVFSGLENKYISAIDKLEKIGQDAVLKELTAKGLSLKAAKETLTKIENAKPTETVEKIKTYLTALNPDFNVEFKPTLARGLNYYTGAIFELSVDGSNSLGGGGRYDKLVGMFSKNDVPAVGFSFGFDRLMEVMTEQNLFPKAETNDVLVSIFNKDFLPTSLQIVRSLRSSNINSEIYLDVDAKLDKQLKYADQKGIRFVVIIGPEEKEKNLITVKNLETTEQKQISLNEFIAFIR